MAQAARAQVLRRMGQEQVPEKVCLGFSAQEMSPDSERPTWRL